MHVARQELAWSAERGSSITRFALGATLWRHSSASSEAMSETVVHPGPMPSSSCVHTAGHWGIMGASVAYQSHSLGFLFSQLDEFQREICTLNRNLLHQTLELASEGYPSCLFCVPDYRPRHFHCGKSHMRWCGVPSKLC